MKAKAIVLMSSSAFFAAVAQLLYKVGARRLALTVPGLLGNWPLVLGVLSYCVALVFMLWAYRYGELTLLYPILASTYIWVLALSPLVFEDERVFLSNGAGIALIVVGITLVGKASR